MSFEIDIRKTLEEARENRELDAACTYLVLKYYEELKDYESDALLKLFGRNDSWLTEYRKAQALYRYNQRAKELPQMTKTNKLLSNLHKRLDEMDKQTKEMRMDYFGIRFSYDLIAKELGTKKYSEEME